MTDIETLSHITKAYDWRGNHTGWTAKQDNKQLSIPFDTGNRHCQEILKASKAGKIAEAEPEITSAVKTVDQNGCLTGYDTSIGFIPHDPTNMLYEILITAVEAKNLKIGETKEEGGAAEKKIDAVIIYVLFDKPWPNLSGKFTRTFPYRSHNKSPIHDVRTSIYNIPSKTNEGIANTVLKENSINSEGLPIIIPLHTAVLKIEFPTTDIGKIFRSEKKYLYDFEKTFLLDSLEMHLVRSGRSKKRGPDINWLIINSPHYLTRLATSVANLASTAYILEWGGESPGHVKRKRALERMMFFGECSEGTTVLSWPVGTRNLFSNNGEWHDTTIIRELLNPENNPVGHKKHILKRVRSLFDAGFAMESISLLNAYLERLFKLVLINSIRMYPDAVSAINKIGHRDRISIVKEISRKFPSEYPFNKILETIPIVIEIYQHRNDYMHDLALPNGQLWMSTEIDEKVEALITPFTENIGPSGFASCFVSLANPDEKYAPLIRNFSVKSLRNPG